MRDTALIDTIDCLYEAAFDRSQWPKCLRHTAHLIGAATCALLGRSPVSGQWRIISNLGLSEGFIASYNSDGHRQEQFIGGFGFDFHESLTVLRFDEQTPLEGPFAEAFRESGPFRVGLLAGSSGLDGTAILSWRPGARPFSDEEEQALRRLWPHVVNARIVESSRMESPPAASRSWAEAVLDCWHVGVIGFSPAGLQVVANEAAREIVAVGDGLSIARDGPLASSARETRALRDAIRLLGRGTDTGPEWLRLTRPSGARAYEVALYRLPSMVSGDPLVVMFVTAPDASIALSAAALRRLHGLTDLEFKVANSLAHGMHVREMVLALGLTLQTARWYVQQVRQKMEAASQTDVARFLIRSVTGIDLVTTYSRSRNRKS